MGDDGEIAAVSGAFSGAQINLFFLRLSHTEFPV